MSDVSPPARLSWRDLFRVRDCRLCQRVAMTVLIAILLIEVVILVPSALRFERVFVDQTESTALAGFFGAVDALSPSIDIYMAAENVAEAASRAMVRAPLTGGLVVTGSDRAFAFGDASDVSPETQEGWVEGRVRYAVTWSPEESATPFRVVAILDTSDLAIEARNYVLRIAGLVLIITAVVTLATLAVVNAVVLRRVLRLDRTLSAAAEDIDHPERYVGEYAGQDELSAVGRAANTLLERLSAQLAAIRGSQRALETLNADLENRVMDRTRALARAEAEARLLARLPEENPEPVLRIDRDGVVVYANPPGKRTLAAIGVQVGDRAPAEWGSILDSALSGSGGTEQTLTCGARFFDFRFAPVPEAGYVNAYGRDVTAERRAEERAARASTHDPLTELPNRALFMHRLAQALAGAQRRGGASLFVIGLKRFAEVNDALGFEGGDRALVEVAKRLRAIARSEDEVARIGGDEFAIIAPDLRDTGAASGLAARVADALGAPIAADGRLVDVEAAIGVAAFDAGARDVSADELVRQAGLAMFRAKSGAGTTTAFFDPDRDEEARRARAMTHALRSALADGRFELHYQPKIGIVDGRLVGAEALIRMRDEEGALVSPGAFIPAAERSGLITPIGRWALMESARAFARAAKDFGLAAPVAVNISAVQLAEEDVPALVAETLKETGLPAGMLELEVTESAVIGDMDRAIEQLDAVVATGVSVAIDDFGTGQSSLSYLRRLPATKMKLDRSFVIDIENDHEAATVARAVVGLGRGLEMKTVAEGVETVGQFRHLRTIGVDEVQGFLFARPTVEEEFRRIAQAAQPFLGVAEAA